MTLTEEQAKAFTDKWGGEWNDASREAYSALPAGARMLVRETEKAKHFDPKNKVVGSERKHVSPSGKYVLTTTHYATGPSSWDYVEGVVCPKDERTPIAVIRRNYSAFPFLFVEEHENKHDYLIAGEDYQGQSVVELDTQKRRDHLDSDAEVGAGFCWSEYRYESTTRTLVVCGCIWACPYEHRFYDFSDPMSGWEEIQTRDGVEASGKEPELDADGTLRCFETRGDQEPEDGAQPIVDVLRTYKRVGMMFELTSEWVSDHEKTERAKREESERKNKEETLRFKTSDPLYLAYAELLKDPALTPADYEGVGQTFDGWGDEWKGKEKRWSRRIVESKSKAKGPIVDLEWAIETGPIKLLFYRDGNSAGHKFFEHSAEGMRQAFAAAKEFTR